MMSHSNCIQSCFTPFARDATAVHIADECVLMFVVYRWLQPSSALFKHQPMQQPVLVVYQDLLLSLVLTLLLFLLSTLLLCENGAAAVA